MTLLLDPSHWLPGLLWTLLSLVLVAGLLVLGTLLGRGLGVHR